MSNESSSVVITGASSGIGRALSLEMARGQGHIVEGVDIGKLPFAVSPE